MNYGAFAQPSNDVCSGAISLPTDGSCLNRQTTLGAGDHWVGTVGCQSGNNNEVWYTFVANGTQADITITQGTMTGDIEVIVVEDQAPPCGALSVTGSNCAPGPTTVTTVSNLSPGATYYVTVNSTGLDGEFQICNLVSSPPPVPGFDCTTAAPLCDANGFSQGVFSGIGMPEEISWNSCFGSDERQAKWYTFTVDEDGILGFDIIPNNLSDDYDWAIWNTTNGCYSGGDTMPAPIACNWSGTSGSTGLNYLSTGTTTPNPCTQTGATDCQTGGGPNSGCQPCTYFNSAAGNYNNLNFVAGETYTILIDNFTANGNGFSFNFGGDAELGPDATFGAALDASCYTVTLDRLTNYIGPNMSYNWSFGDGNTSTDPTPVHTYTTSGLYIITLDVTDAVGCVSTFSLTVDIGCTLLSSRIDNFSGSYAETHNTLLLEMASNKDFSHFVVQRSLDGSDWNDIGEVSANGEEGNLSYDFNDYNYYLNSNNYYRLKMFNIAGEITFSEIIVIENKEFAHGGLFVHNIYPTPFTDQLSIEIESDKLQSLKLMLFDLLGHKVIDRYFSVNQNINKLDLDLESIEAGIYLLQIATNDDVISLQRKIVKK